MKKKSSKPAEEQRNEPEGRKRQGSNQPIAIVGMACRFPGAPNLSAFWHLLKAGDDAVTDGRQDSGPWNGISGDPEAGPGAYRHGAFVEEIDRFDASLFGIRPIEARMMDPRQRMVLETSWQAIEDAGINPDRLNGSRTGVYIGGGNSDYRDLIVASGKDDSYVGTFVSVTVGRVAFALGLMGPALYLDTGCTSSLVAVHQAVAALQRGEVNLALVGGVNAILSPGIMKFMKDLGMLSASGQCRIFDASADGCVIGEGCGMVVLKRLSEAEAEGDRIWGVVRGSAVNQNGASAGLAVPNGPAQERVIEEALWRAGVSPAEVDYLEAHGMGIVLIDSIEVQAAAAVYGKERNAERPLLIGSVKTNIGNLECASGMAGLIKVVLAMKQGEIPKHLHFRNPNPQIDWDRLAVRVTSKAMDWPHTPERPPRAGISAIAFGGTNAHVVVEGSGDPDAAGLDTRRWPTPGPRNPLPASMADLPLAEEEFAARQTRFLPLSGKSDAVLRDLAKQYQSWLDELGLSSENAADSLLADMAWTAGVGRSHFEHRSGIIFRDAVSLRDGLRKLETETRPEPRSATKVAFAYTGEAGHWIEMGEALYASEPVVRAALDRCDSVLREVRGASLLDVMFRQPPEALNDAAWTHPAIYALECALTALWASVGIQPNVVVGHGPGELAAAQAAGVFGLEDGLRLAAARGTRIGELPEGGTQTTAHDDLQATLKGVAIAPPSLTLVSGVTGRGVETGEVLDAAYWRHQASEPGASDRYMETLADLGVETLVEIGPCAPSISACSPLGDGVVKAGIHKTLVVLSSLPKPDDSTAKTAAGGFVKAVAEAYAAGLPVSFDGLFAGETRRRISLPVYPFQRQRHWIAM